MGKESKIFKTFFAENIKFLPGSLKRRKSGQTFPKFSYRTYLKLLGVITTTFFLCRTHHFFPRSKALWEQIFSICFPLAAFEVQRFELERLSTYFLAPSSLFSSNFYPSNLSESLYNPNKKLSPLGIRIRERVNKVPQVILFHVSSYLF